MVEKLINKNMNILLSALLAQAIANHSPIVVNGLGQPCEQIAEYQCLPIGDASKGSVVPTSSVEQAEREVLPSGSMYNVFTITPY